MVNKSFGYHEYFLEVFFSKFVQIRQYWLFFFHLRVFVRKGSIIILQNDEVNILSERTKKNGNVVPNIIVTRAPNRFHCCYFCSNIQRLP